MKPFERRGRLIVKIKRASGSWRQVTMPRGASREQAEQLQLKLELQALHVRLTGELPRELAQPVSQLIEWYIASPRLQRSGELANVKSRLRRWVAPQLGALLPAEVTPSRIEAMLHHVAERRAPKTANHCLGALRGLVLAAQDERLWNTNDPTAHVRPVPVPLHRRPVLELAEAELLLASATGRAGIASALALCLSLRKGEVLGLLVEDLDLEDLVLHVRHSHARAATKNGRWRSLPIPRALEPRLRAWLADGAGKRALFPGRAAGGLLNADYPFAKRVRAELVRLGLRSAADARRFRFHDLRHTWASLAEAAGVPFELRQCVMGHAPNITERYTHRLMDRLRLELEKVFPRPQGGST